MKKNIINNFGLINSTEKYSFKNKLKNENRKNNGECFTISLENIDGYEGIAKLCKTHNGVNEEFLIYFQTPREEQVPFTNGQLFDKEIRLDDVFDSHKNEYISDTFASQQIYGKQTPQTRFTAKILEDLGYGEYRASINNFSDNLLINIREKSKTYKKGDMVSGVGYLTADFSDV